MNVSVQFPVDIENALRNTAAAAGKDVETFVRDIVAERLAEEIPSPVGGRLSHEEFRAKIRELVALRGVTHGHMDDSRESIYEGRGE